MITIDLENKSVSVKDTAGDYVIVDGQLFALTNGEIFLSNLPTMYDVEVLYVTEDHHIPKPEPEPIPEEVIPEELPEEDPTPNE